MLNIHSTNIYYDLLCARHCMKTLRYEKNGDCLEVRA